MRPVFTGPRAAKERAVYYGLHRDFRGVFNDQPCVLVYREALGTCLVATCDLTDGEIERLTPKPKAP